MTTPDIPRGRIRRTMPLAGFTVRAAGGRLVAGLREKAGEDGAVEQFHECAAERYAELLGHSKGVLMKAGQILSMVDARALGTGGFWPYQKALARLQADAPPMRPSLVRKVLRDELGGAVGYFADLCDEPMATASVGQVHRAVLRDGREVVVKIQYPGVAQAIRDDLANTELVATFMRFVVAASGMKVDIKSLAREASARIAEEVDYRHEAATITAFSDLYRGHPFIRIPVAIPEASSDRVLTMTYLDGVDYSAAQRADQDLKNAWAEVTARFSNGNYRHANLVHADPHPGNYRFNADGTVGFLDFGCATIFPEKRRWLWVACLRAAIDGRISDSRDLLIQLGFISADSTLTADELQQWISYTNYPMTMPQPVTFTPDAVARILGGFFDVRDRHHPAAKVTLPPEHAFTTRIVLAFNSVAAGLQATLPIRAIFDDMDGVAEPITELGKLHHAWVRERGLPGALDHHDHP
ncbi:AarF/ABC1/UbiB kinase family protein [Mycobacterium intracellulare]|uniref:ABC1 kinase family protein n=1 Tax=Mycobacterium intracellulare TaxID=1767 RepID=UPI001CDA8D5A|nr:AarF/ABC1/UbiB kinase family protein [Mycobacterium intracellulare]MCA2253440.1 AarF/ABC1/UbiB kinase family protein [Mycobacterium intracellulare]